MNYNCDLDLPVDSLLDSCISETVVTVPCTIKGISKWSEKSMFETLASVPLNEIPYWSVYEVNPYGTSTNHLDRNTFYRVTVFDTLPSSQILPPS